MVPLQVRLWPQNRLTFLGGLTEGLSFSRAMSFQLHNVLNILETIHIWLFFALGKKGSRQGPQQTLDRLLCPLFKGAYLIFQTGGHRPERIPSRYKTAWYPNNSGLCWSLCPRRMVPLESTEPEPWRWRNPSQPAAVCGLIQAQNPTAMSRGPSGRTPGKSNGAAAERCRA